MSPHADIPARLAAYAPVSLAELDARASLQTRVDRKYVVDSTCLDRLLVEWRRLATVLEIGGARSAGYQSVYFDTPDLASFHGTAHPRRRRFKVRTRAYFDSQQAFLEVKTRGRRGTTVKRREPHPFNDRIRLGADGSRFVDASLGRSVAAALQPTLATAYRRITLAGLADVTRVTIDAGLVCHDLATSKRVQLDDRYILETKSEGAPSQFDRWLWKHGQRPEKISKFGTGLAVLRPELPRNKWHRTIRRHFVHTAVAERT